MKNKHKPRHENKQVFEVMMALYRLNGKAMLKDIYLEVDTSAWVNNHNREAKIRQILNLPQDRYLFQPTGNKGEWELAHFAIIFCINYSQNPNREALQQQVDELRKELDDIKSQPRQTVVKIVTDTMEVNANAVQMNDQQQSAGCASATSHGDVLPCPDFSQVTAEQFERACLLLQQEQRISNGQPMPLIGSSGDWYAVERIAYETGFYHQLNRHQQFVRHLLDAESLPDAEGQCHAIRFMPVASNLSRTASVFGQPRARLFAPLSEDRWHAHDSFDDNALRQAELVARTFVTLLSQIVAQADT